MQDRIIDFDWNHYNAGKVVFKPKHMTPEKLQELYGYAWDTFYKDETQSEKMFKMFQNVIMREMADGTYQGRRKDLMQNSFGKNLSR
jgi:hypothetical protein